MVPSVFLSVTVSSRRLPAFAQRGPPEVVVCLRGDHDLSTVAELSATMAQAMALGDTDLVVDLSRVELMTAATVVVLVRARELLRVRSRSLLVRSPSTPARRVLELSDLRDLLEHRSVDTRLAAAAGALRKVTVRTIEGIDRGVEVSMLDRVPKIGLVEPVETGTEMSSDDVHRRADEQPMKAAG
jgi:anti-anti-sigma factor